MKRIRDAKTGKYISEEEAELKDKSTWIIEEDFDKEEFLKLIFNDLRKKVSKIISKSNESIENQLVLTLKEIKEVFNKNGAKL